MSALFIFDYFSLAAALIPPSFSLFPSAFLSLAPALQILVISHLAKPVHILLLLLFPGCFVFESHPLSSFFSQPLFFSTVSFICFLTAPLTPSSSFFSLSHEETRKPAVAAGVVGFPVLLQSYSSVSAWKLLLRTHIPCSLSPETNYSHGAFLDPANRMRKILHSSNSFE